MLKRKIATCMCAAAFALLSVDFAQNASAACYVWYKAKCCDLTGVSRPIPCGGGFCNNIIINDPTVGTWTLLSAGWSGPFLCSIDECKYYPAACFGPGLCAISLTPAAKQCRDCACPTTKPNCP